MSADVRLRNFVLCGKSQVTEQILKYLFNTDWRLHDTQHTRQHEKQNDKWQNTDNFTQWAVRDCVSCLSSYFTGSWMWSLRSKNRIHYIPNVNVNSNFVYARKPNKRCCYCTASGRVCTSPFGHPEYASILRFLLSDLARGGSIFHVQSTPQSMHKPDFQN